MRSRGYESPRRLSHGAVTLLEPLSDDAMRQLLLGLACDLPEPALAQILERAEGVPLYAVEMVRMLVDQGRLARDDGSYRLTGELLHLDIPDSLHGLIASRLDVLAPQHRSLLQDAAVLGKTFTVEALGAVSDKAAEGLEPLLKELVRKELLVVDLDPRSPERGQYGFVQSLIQEVAYQTLSKRDRLTKHLSAAHYFEALGDDELASVVAAHYLDAYEAAPQGPQAQALAARARDSLVTAAERASALGAHRQALAHIEMALTVAGEGDQVTLWENAAEAAHKAAVFDVAENYLSQAIAWYERHGDSAGAARATALLGSALLGADRIDAAINTLTTALARENSDGTGEAVALMAELGRAYFRKGDFEVAAEWVDKVLPVAARVDALPVITEALITKGTAVSFLGRTQEGLAILRGALSLATEHDLPLQRLRVLNNLAGTAGLHSPREAAAASKEGLVIARRLGVRGWELNCAENYASASLSTGEWEAAMAILDETYTQEIADLEDIAWLQIESTKFKVLEGNSPEDALERARLIVEKSEDFQLVAALHHVEAWIALAQGDLEKAYDAAIAASRRDPGGNGPIGLAIATRAALWMSDIKRAKESLDLLKEQAQGRNWLTLNERSLQACLSILNGDASASKGFAELAESWRRLDVPFDLGLFELDFVAVTGGDNPDAQDAAQEASDIFTRLGAKPFLDRLDAAIATASRA